MSLALAAPAAADILIDVYGRGRRQQLPVMEAVWPVPALWLIRRGSTEAM